MNSQVQRTTKKNDGNSHPLITTAASEESHERQHNPLQKSQAMVEKLLSNFQKETVGKEKNKAPTTTSMNSLQNKGSNQPLSTNASSEKGRENSIRKHTSMEKSQFVTERELCNVQAETTRKAVNKPLTMANMSSQAKRLDKKSKGSNQPLNSLSQGEANSLRHHNRIEKSQLVGTSQKKQSTQRSMAQDEGSGENQHNPRKKAKKAPICRPMSIDEFLHENGEACNIPEF
ncbi:hypothetical protein RIF29_38469 [Crotalaria pallida]|uniref:Uncharacterized protein n=1 Tax=Crotalaria pallida TaxID=3830 RepID=A0AAN9HNZ3_CROPI